MNDHCKRCELVQCDFLDRACRLLDSQVLTLRPDLIMPMTKHQRWYVVNRTHKKAYVANWSKNNMAKKVAANKRYRGRLRERRASGR